MEERTGLPYASGNGAMHACGHDLHLAAAAGAADVLARGAAHRRGTLVVLGRPAEETPTGARAVPADGLDERFGRPDAVLAQHATPLPAGMVAHGTPGAPLTAASTALYVVVHGRGGHAGTPHLAVDPVVATAAVITRLRTIVSRESAPADQLTLTVGTLRAGTAGNVVPDTAELGSPALWGDPAATRTVRAAHTGLYGSARVADRPPSPASEDFPLHGGAGAAPHGEKDVLLVHWVTGTASPRQWAASAGRLPPTTPLSSRPTCGRPCRRPSPRSRRRLGTLAGPEIPDRAATG